MPRRTWRSDKLGSRSFPSAGDGSMISRRHLANLLRRSLRCYQYTRSEIADPERPCCQIIPEHYDKQRKEKIKIDALVINKLKSCIGEPIVLQQFLHCREITAMIKCQESVIVFFPPFGVKGADQATGEPVRQRAVHQRKGRIPSGKRMEHDP